MKMAYRLDTYFCDADKTTLCSRTGTSMVAQRTRRWHGCRLANQAVIAPASTDGVEGAFSSVNRTLTDHILPNNSHFLPPPFIFFFHNLTHSHENKHTSRPAPPVYYGSAPQPPGLAATDHRSDCFHHDFDFTLIADRHLHGVRALSFHWGYGVPLRLPNWIKTKTKDIVETEEKQTKCNVFQP